MHCNGLSLFLKYLHYFHHSHHPVAAENCRAKINHAKVPMCYLHQHRSYMFYQVVKYTAGYIAALMQEYECHCVLVCTEDSLQVIRQGTDDGLYKSIQFVHNSIFDL